MDRHDRHAAADANRRRYEELRAAGQGETARSLPPASALPAPEPAGMIIAAESLPGGCYLTMRVRRGEAFRIATPGGDAAAAVIAWREADPSERINVADTVKVQWTAALQKGRVILSDMGRVVFSIVEDSSAAHDTLVGGSNRMSNAERFGEGPWRNTRDNFVAAVGKLGLTKRDIPPCITFFAPVFVAQDGSFRWDPDRRRSNDYVDLRAEMDLLVAVSACPHPMDPSPTYRPGRIDMTRFKPGPARDDDLSRAAGPEARRAFAATDRLAQ